MQGQSDLGAFLLCGIRFLRSEEWLIPTKHQAVELTSTISREATQLAIEYRSPTAHRRG